MTVLDGPSLAYLSATTHLLLDLTACDYVSASTPAPETASPALPHGVLLALGGMSGDELVLDAARARRIGEALVRAAEVLDRS